MLKYFLYLTLPLYLLDQVTKALVVKHIERDFGMVEITSFFNLTHIRNEGVAFGMANGNSWANPVFGLVSATALFAIFILWKRDAFPTVMSKIAAALLGSGILGNLTDRLARGSVVDFLDFHWNEKHFANFNVADSCICIAAGLIFITAFLPEPKEEEDSAEDEEPKEEEPEEEDNLPESDSQADDAVEVTVTTEVSVNRKSSGQAE